MSTPGLTPTSYLVLGMVAHEGALTPYEMKQKVALSIGHFWSFPHSQLYAEPDRLVDLGLLGVEQEPSGRRRKRYVLTPAGREALLRWLGDPTPDRWEVRDPGLLKLFFLDLVDTDAVAAHARAQAEHHRELLAELEAIEAAFADAPELAYPMLTLRLGKGVARAYVEFWGAVMADPPEIGPRTSPSTSSAPATHTRSKR